MNDEIKNEIKTKDHSLITFLVTAILSLFIPALGIFAMIAVCAAVGAGLAASHSPYRFAAVIPGCAGAWLGGMFFETSSVAALGLYVISVLLGFVIAHSAKKHDSASAQVLKVSSLFALIFAVLGGMLIYSEFGSLTEAGKALGDYLSSGFSATLDMMIKNDTTGKLSTVLGSISPDDIARDIVMITPGILLTACEVFGWIASLLSRPIMTLYGRGDLRPMPPVITLPVSAAVIFAVSFVISVFSSDALYYVLENLVMVMTPAFACAGVTAFRLYTRRSPGGKSVLVVILAIVLVLIQPAMIVYVLAAAGFAHTIRMGLESRMKK